VQEGFGRGRVVMLNEAHDGLKRCVRTRRVGRQVLPSTPAMASGTWPRKRCGPATARPPTPAGWAIVVLVAWGRRADRVRRQRDDLSWAAGVRTAAR
jgi:hypothetical protein